MAIERVFGRVDGVDIVLQNIEGNRWSVPVPFDVDGRYIVEIFAEDDAGNQTYLAKVLFCVDSSKLCAHMIPVPYYAQLIISGFNTEVIQTKRHTKLISTEFYVDVAQASYYAEIIEPHCER